MKTLINRKKVVIATGELDEFTADEANAGYDQAKGSYKIDGKIYPSMLNLTLVDVDGEPTPQKHKIVDGKIVDNEAYVTPK